MAPLTWRNVHGANLGDPMDGLRLSGNFLDRGLRGLNESLSQFSGWTDDQNARQVQAAALRVQDPVELRRMLGDGSFLAGMSPGALTPAAATALQGRVGTLLEQASAEQQLGTARQLDPHRIAAAGVGVDQARQNLATSVAQDPIRTGLLQTNLDSSRHTLSERQAEDLAVRQAQDFFTRARTNRWTAGDVTEQLANSGLSGRALMLAQQLMEQDVNTPSQIYPMAGGGAPAPAADGRAGGGRTPAGAALGSASGSNPTTVLQADASGSIVDSIPIRETRDYVRNITGSYRAANGGALPTGSSEQIADALLGHVERQESGGRQGAVSSAGARGVLQLMPGTARELERRLGMAPGSTDTDAAANRRAGRQYLVDQLEANNGNVELALAAYNAGPNRVAGWGAPAVAASLTRQGAGAARTASDTEQGVAARRTSQSPGIVPEYAEAVANNAAQPHQIVNQLIGTAAAPGPYWGRTGGEVTDMLNGVVARGKGRINVATAGAILARRLSTENSSYVPSWVPFVGGSRRTTPDDAAVQQDVDRFLATDTARDVRVAETTARAQASVQAAREKVTSLGMDLERLAAAAQRNNNLLPQFREAQRAYRRAVETLQTVTSAAREFIEEPIRPPGGNPTSSPAISTSPAGFGSIYAAPRVSPEEAARIRQRFGG